MKGFKLVVYYVLQWTWGFIQNFIGLMMRFYVLSKDKKKEKASFKFFGAQVTEWNKGHGSMGMGMFIFLGHRGDERENEVLVHEYGHTWQSALLGPLYLFVIGIPSFTWAWLPVFNKMRKEKGVKYVDFYPEAWANAWGTAVTGMEAPKW